MIILQVLMVLACAVASAGATTATTLPGAGTGDIYSDPDLEFGLVLPEDDTADEGATVQAPLLASLVEIQVTGIVARARVTQMFSNPSDQRVEAVYVFPIPDQAAVDELRLRVGDREVIGEIREIAEAEAVYREAEADGRVATLLTKQRDDVFTTRVTQIGPGETVEIEIGLQYLVDYDDGAFRLRFPLVVAPRYAPAGADVMPYDASLLQPPVDSDVEQLAAFHVTLDAGFPLAELESPSHEILTSKAAAGGSIVRLADEMVAAGRDFLLTWRPQRGTTPRTTVLVDEVDGERYALVMIIPPNAPNAPNAADVRLPRETIFVIDTSGSMSGGKLARARRAILLALDSFRPGDRLNVIRFSSTVTPLFRAPSPVTEASLREARDFVKDLRTDGGTEMKPALDRALLDVSSSEDLRQVIFITDGRVTNEAELYQLVQEKLGRSRIFTVGIGEAPNAAFMRRVATLGRGTFTFIDGSDVAGPMRALLRTLDSPTLRDIELTWNDPSVDPERDVLPARIPDLYLGRPLVVAARIGRATELHAAGWLRDRFLELKVPLASYGGAARASTAGIDREWAKRRVQTLVLPAVGDDRSSERAQEAVRQEITELGLRHHIVTPFTSLVGVDVVRSAPRGEAPKRVVMPAPPVDVGLSDLVAETLVVTAEVPMIDVTKVHSGVSVEELEVVPFLTRKASDALARMPGVQVDHAGLDRLDGGAPGAGLRVVSRAGSNASTWEVDGLVIPELETVGRPPVYDEFESLEETSVFHDIEAADDGVTVQLRTARGGNSLRAAAEFRAVGDSARKPSRDAISGQSLVRDRVVADDYVTANLGGPLLRDRLWARIAGEQRDGERAALGGEIGRHERRTGTGRLDVSLHDKAALVARWNRGEQADLGLGAGPSRAPSSLLDLDASISTRSLEGSFIATPSLFFTGLYGEVEMEGSLAARGGEAPRWGADGILRGDLGARRESLNRRQLRLSTSYFVDLWGAAHEVKLGARMIDDEQWLSRRGPGTDGVLSIDGALFGIPSEDLGLFEPSGSAALNSRHRSLWLQEQAQLEHWTATVGLRWDEQRAGLAEGQTLSWRTLSPRVSLARFFGYDRRTALRMMWGRFDQSLSPDVLARTVPGLSGRALFGDDASLLDGGGAVLRHQTDPDLDAAPTDELALWLEQQIGSSAVVSLGLVHRRQRNVAEQRSLIFDGDLLRPSTADDYALDHVATGVRPDGSQFSVPVYSLRPGLQDSGARRLTNGSRDIEYEGVTLRFRKRFRWMWSAEGHLHYGDARWRVGEAYAAGQDPTNLLGDGDRDGDRVVVAPEETDLSFGPSLGRPWPGNPWLGGPWLGARWSAELAATVKLFADRPWELFVTGEFHAREGGPLPYYAWDATGTDGRASLIQTTRAVDGFRLDDVVTMDLEIAKPFDGLGPQLTTLTLQVLNLTDDDTALDRELLVSSPRAGWIDERVASRTVRLGVRFSWD